MRRGFLLVLTLLPFTAAASAQAPAQAPLPLPVQAQAQALVQWPAQARGQQVVFSVSPPTLVARGTDDLVARILSFDRNNDGKVTRDELNERMQPLVSRGDANGDSALDRTELRTLANVPARTPVSVRGFPASAGGYGFGDDDGQTSRLHIEGAIEDLRLSADTREHALAAARSFVDTLEASSSATLLREMESLLTAEQLAEFRQALETEGSSRATTPPPTVTRAGVGQIREVVVNERVIRLVTFQQVFGLAAERRLAQYKLPAAQQQQALAALKRFRAQRRIGDAERSALVEQLSGILSDEERDNFRAALERRPVVKQGGALAFNSGQVIKTGDALTFSVGKTFTAGATDTFVTSPNNGVVR